MESQTKKFIIYLILPFTLLGIVVLIANFESRPDHRLRLNFYNVGGGDAALIQTYQGRKIVIDGGSTDKVLTKIGLDLPFFDHSIDLLILDYPTTNEVTGLVDILNRYSVKKVMLPASDMSNPAFQEFLQIVSDKHIQKIFAQSGQRIWLDDSTVFDVYYPPQGETGIIGKLEFGKTQALFVGIASPSIQHDLVNKTNLHAQILKLSANAVKSTISDEFTQAVNADYTIKPGDETNFVSDGVNLYKN